MRVTDSIPDKSVINSKWLAAIAFHIIGLGILAIVFPIFFTLTSALVFGWIFIGAGICQLGGWILVSGIVGIVCGIFVWSSFSSSAPWLIGTFIGVNLLFDGIWMLTPHSVQRLPEEQSA
ncbi:MAG: DUF308 domain-containing protein [Phormidesmis sp.]